jgi:hypothetical protein
VDFVLGIGKDEINRGCVKDTTNPSVTKPGPSITPAVIWDIYNVPNGTNATVAGNTQAVASPYGEMCDPSDMVSYEKKFNLPPLQLLNVTSSSQRCIGKSPAPEPVSTSTPLGL